MAQRAGEGQRWPCFPRVAVTIPCTCGRSRLSRSPPRTLKAPIGVWFVLHRNIVAHRRIMLRTYLAGCVGAGLFALMPQRLLGGMLWHQVLALV